MNTLTIGTITLDEGEPSTVASRMEDVMLQLMEPEDIPVIHHIGEVEGVYVREGTIQAGRYVLGHKHKTRHYMLITRGKMRLVDGDKVEDVGPGLLLCEPGVRKIAHITEELHGYNIMGTDMTDVFAAEAELIEKSPAYLEWSEKKQVKQLVA